MHARDLVQMPAKPNKQSTRRPAKKVPSWHLTSEISMKYINDVSSRQAEKKKTEEKYEKVKKEAVKNLKKEERKSKAKVTRLDQPKRVR